MADHIVQASAVALDGRALLIEGPPGSGKSSLALALIGCGARLIGDDAVSVTLERKGTVDRLIAAPPPNIAGLLEVRGVGIVTRQTAPPATIALILKLVEGGERMPDGPDTCAILGVDVPLLRFEPGTIAPAQRALAALELHGLGTAAPQPRHAGQTK